MPKFRKFIKKPVIIEAIQWTGKEDCWKEIHELSKNIIWWKDEKLNVSRLEIKTLEGVMTAGIGDWIIRGIRGEFYPCKPDIFEATYAPLEVLK